MPARRRLPSPDESPRSAGTVDRCCVEQIIQQGVKLPAVLGKKILQRINAYVKGAGVDGLITDFPATARRYKLNNCMNMGNTTPSFMAPAHPGDLMQVISQKDQPPALAPMPLLTGSDVVEPPLPPARPNSSTAPTHSATTRTHAYATHILGLVTLAMFFSWCSLV